ncbi:MAG: 3-deoxy-D-manno-octulosonic acid transferase, partial [Candidatus Omnitrophica bacterium]|nr:3-deoxy-D-manno-octulosonic acid transferase [Candidatus Omnitrophota bacterium]
APRHPERSNLPTFLKRKDLKYILWSKEGERLDREKIVILDTMGELPLFYRLATLVFVGGSLIPWGGHNILEPSAFKKPVLFGPYMGNFSEEAAALKASGGAIEVKDAESLSSAFSGLLAKPERTKSMGEACFQVVKQHLGATEKSLELIKGLI